MEGGRNQSTRRLMQILDVRRLEELPTELDSGLQIIAMSHDRNHLRARILELYYCQHKDAMSIAQQCGVAGEAVRTIVNDIADLFFTIPFLNGFLWHGGQWRSTVQVRRWLKSGWKRPEEAIPVEWLNVPNHVTHQLRRAGIPTIDFLLKCTEKELRQGKGIGETSIQEIHAALQELGGSLRENPKLTKRKNIKIEEIDA